MQHGDSDAMPEPQEERDARLDARYREDGWGLITDQVWAGRVRPVDVESPARDVARWAYEQVKASTALTNEQGTKLIRLEKELEDMSHYSGQVARMAPQIQGLKGALRLKDVELKRANVERAQEAAGRAAAELRLAECELVLAEMKSHVGGDMPTTLNPRALRDWLNPPAEGESGCNHD